MQLTPEHQGCLARAFDRLAIGDSRSFEDMLWLGFGDGWQPLLGMLARGGYVRFGGEDRVTPAITSRGSELLTKLQDAAAQPTA